MFCLRACYALLWFKILTNCFAFDQRSDRPLYPMYTRSALPPLQGKMNYDGINGYSSLSLLSGKANSSLLNKNASSPQNAQLAPLGVDYASVLRMKSSQRKAKYPSRNDLHYQNASVLASLRNKSSLDTNASFPIQNSKDSSSLSHAVSFAHGACPLSKGGDINSKQKSINSTAKKLLKSPYPLNRTRKRYYRLASRMNTLNSDRYSDPNQNPDGFTPEEVAGWPGTDTLPPVPSDHNQAWKACWIRGQAAWNALPTAYASLEDNSFINLAPWQPHCVLSRSRPVQLCENNGLLTKINIEDSPPVDLCGPTQDLWQMFLSVNDPMADFFSSNSFSMETGTIVNWSWEGAYEGLDEVLWAPDSWADITMPLWSNICNQNGRLPSSLRYIVFADTGEGEVSDVLSDILQQDPTLEDEDEFDGNTKMATYTPRDDNFYALLGTKIGVGAIELLYNYPGSFSRRMDDGTRMVKIIKSVRFSASTTTLPADYQNSASRDDNFRFAMAFTLEEVYI